MKSKCLDCGQEYEGSIEEIEPESNQTLILGPLALSLMHHHTDCHNNHPNQLGVSTIGHRGLCRVHLAFDSGEFVGSIQVASKVAALYKGVKLTNQDYYSVLDY